MTKTLNFRNHVFLLTAKGWTLSPAYDMTPTPMSIKICLSHQLPNRADLNVLLDTCEDYMLNLKTAKKIISEVVEAMKGWSKLVVRLEISKREMDMFAGVLDKRRIGIAI